jgi:ankyrin repeat protein
MSNQGKKDGQEPVTGQAVPLRRPLAFNRAAVPDAATVTGDELATTAKRHQRTLAFFAAAKQDNPSIADMRRLVSSGIDLSWVGEDGDAPLHVALRLNSLQLAKDLLAAGANPRQKTRSGQTPLSLAIGLGLGVPGATLLIEGGADVNEACQVPADAELDRYAKETELWIGTRRKRGATSTPIHDALRQKDTALAVCLAAAGADTNVRSSGGYTPLHIMLMQKDMASVESLLGYGADAALKTACGVTPLSLAIDYGLGQEGCDLLLKCGADITASSTSGITDLSFGDSKILAGAIRRDGTAHDVVQDALRAGDIDLAKHLIGHGAPLNGASGDGSTALSIALKNDNLDFAGWLLDQGADPDACGKGERAYTPLQVAMWKSREMMQMLLDRGASLDAQNGDGDTALHHAVNCSRTHDVEWLVFKGADLYLKNKYGKTPLLCALDGHNGLLESADLLIARDPNLMKHWKDGKHAIHYAAESRNGERTVTKLLEYGVPARLEDEKGHMPLYYAAFEGNGTAEALIYAGALKGATDEEIETYKKKRTKGKEGYEYWHWNIPGIIDRALPKSDKLAKEAVWLERRTEKQLRDIDRRVFQALQNSGSNEHIGTLVKEGASLDARNDAGQTPLIFACMQARSDDTCEYLAKNSDLLAVDDSGRTALHYAVQHVDMGATVRYMVDNGVDVDAQDKTYGRTALMFATKGGNYVAFLMKRDADISLKDKLGLTARQIAHLHRNKYAEADIAAVEQEAKTTPRRKRPKPLRREESRFGYRFGGGMGFGW